MTGKILFFLFMCTTGTVMAQDLDISLFDEIPNLGRESQPLDSLLLTPPPAPDIRIDLDNTKTPEQTTTAQPALPNQPLPQLPSTHIDLSGTTPLDLPEKPSAETQKPSDVEETSSYPPQDVTSFDISDFYLGVPAYQVLQLAKQKGYKIKSTQEEVPLFFATNYAYQCRKEGALTPDSVTKCIKDKACKEKTRYIKEAVLRRKNEILQLYFTSNATDNQLYKIIYINKGDNSLNFTQINTAKKKLRMHEFWNAVFDKYGYPDDEKNYVWGDPKKAYMKAFLTGSSYDAYIILEDIQLSNEDYFEAEDIENERPPRYTFTF